MLTAEKKVWFDKIFSVYNRNLIKRRFHSFNVENINSLFQRDREIPLIIYANHSSWWDGLILYEIWRTAKIDGFVMMEEKQLEDLQLFRKLGAFSVVRENPREAVKSINYAVDLLKNKANRAVLIFPQGEIKPNDARPLGFYNGIARIVEKTTNCNVLPVALKYEFLNEFKPEIYVKIGEIQKNSKNETQNSRELSKDYEIKLTSLLDDLKSDIATRATGNYKKLL